MKQLTDQQILEAFDKALAEAAQIAARRRREVVEREKGRKGAAEDQATYDPSRR